MEEPSILIFVSAISLKYHKVNFNYFIYKDMIELLKKAGLGYRTGEADVLDRIGDIPLRELVYRVHPLPPSLKPLIWDFGSMDNTTGIALFAYLVTCD